MTKVISLTRWPDKQVFVNPDSINYITTTDIGPTKTRIYFNGDRANCIDVTEDIEDVAAKIFTAGLLLPTYDLKENTDETPEMDNCTPT